MKVIVLADGETYTSEVAETNIKNIISIISLHHGEAIANYIIEQEFKYIADTGGWSKALTSTDLDYIEADTLIICKDIDGELPAAAIVAAYGAIGVTTVATSTLVAVTQAVVSMAISMAVGAIMNALSPTPETHEPAKLKQSNIFTTGDTNSDQGAAVPYLFGRCFADGIAISTEIISEEQ